MSIREKGVLKIRTKPTKELRKKKKKKPPSKILSIQIAIQMKKKPSNRRRKGRSKS